MRGLEPHGLFSLYPRDQIFLVECAYLLSLAKGIIEPLEGLELGKHRPVKFIHALECLVADCLLMVGQEEASEILIHEKVPRVEGRPWL